MNIHEPFPDMTVSYYFKTMPMGFVYWIPLLMFSFFVPLIGWIMIPVTLFYPLFHPFIIHKRDKKKWQKARQEAIEQATFKKLVPQS